jgi:NAD(P)H-flavin reductase
MLCGCHSLETRLLLPQLKELASFWNFSFVHHVTSQTGNPGWGESVVRGRIVEDNVIQAISKKQPDLCRVLVCGPEAFCKDMKLIVEKIGAKYYCF